MPRSASTFLSTLLAACLLLPACQRDHRTRSLVFITLDTTRADRLGAYGYEAARTPNLDRLAARGTLYSRAYAVAPETLPAHASMFTGLYPPSHGVRLNLVFRLPPEAVTLAELLRDHGIHTVAVTSAVVLDRRYGLDQGFLVYDDPGSAGRLERRAQAVTERALAALEQLGDRPYFLWAHFYDPHSPFSPPAPYRGDDSLPPESPQLYDREIAYMDHWVGELLDGLRARGLLEDALIVATGDHGESLGEHGETYHTLFVYDSTIRVPLLLAGPGIQPGQRVNEVVSSVDLFSSVLALLGIDAPPSSSRVLPGLRTGRGRRNGPRLAYSESMAPPLRHGWHGLEALRTETRLYIRAPTEETYLTDGSDPRQEVNLASGERREVARLRELMATTLAAMPVPGFAGAAGHQPTEDEREALEALGYVGAGGQRPGTSAGADPKEMIEVAEAFQLARLAVRLGRLERAEELLQWAVGADPENPGCGILLGRVYLALGKHAQAAQAFEAARALRPRSWEILSELAVAEELSGRTESAEAHLREALESSEDPANVWRRVGRLWLRGQNREQALRAYRNVLKVHPDDRRARQILERLEAGGSPERAAAGLDPGGT